MSAEPTIDQSLADDEGVSLHMDKLFLEHDKASSEGAEPEATKGEVAVDVRGDAQSEGAEPKATEDEAAVNVRDEASSDGIKLAATENNSTVLNHYLESFRNRGFVPNYTASLEAELRRLVKTAGKGGALGKRQVIKAEAWSAEIARWSFDETRLQLWQNLCADVGISPVPDSITKCRKVFPTLGSHSAGWY